MKPSAFLLCLLAALECSLAQPAAPRGEAGARPTYTLRNPLNLDWPGDLVHLDVPADALPADVSVRIDGETRPAQIQLLEGSKSRQTRVWFIASLKGGKDGEAFKDVTFVPGKTASPLETRIETQPDMVHGDGGATYFTPEHRRKILAVGNGVYTCLMPYYGGPFAKPVAITELSPVVRAVLTEKERLFYGRSWFEGGVRVGGAKTQIVEAGPVYVLIKVTLDLLPPAGEGAGGGAGGAARWFYEATLRFVASDPWIDVAESYRAPPDTRYWLEFKDALRPDTVMWVRWFDYARFGGNSAMHYVPLLPQEKQRGPFVALRPRWSQAPGGGMDFFVTRGGETPSQREAGARPADRPAGPKFSLYDAAAPAVGVIATNPIRWTEPLAQTIEAYAENGDTARLKFPTVSGARTYALVVGPRGQVDTTGKLNSLVRRHTDWSLDDQTNKYVLEWERDPALAGPHVYLTREQLRRLQDDFKAGRDTPEMRTVKEFLKESADNPGEIRGVKGADRDLLDLITGKPVKPANLPSAGAWLGTRYQDDGLNPTQNTNRRVAGQFADADLTGDGRPLGGPWQAALGYVYTDLNNWPGWHNGWNPGNPNFHTDKYRPAIYAAAALLDHPDARRWLAFGADNFKEDLAKVSLPPDGVGYECPGYSGYSMNLQLETAKVLANVGAGNVAGEDPTFRQSGRWHRNLLTPFDRRLGKRHEAPIGDTHRWTSGLGEGFGKLAKLSKDADPAFASEMMGVRRLLREQGLRGSLMGDLIDVDLSIPAAPIDKMDWGSRAWHGFGAIMRSRFGAGDETFVTFKAGPARGHYHNDELSYHFYGAGTPLSLDYNCSYHPRGDHAALHNSMTFGAAGPFTHAGDEKGVEAMEQMLGAARVGAFNSTPAGDVVAAEVTADALTLSPVYPDDAKFQYAYPSRKVEPITHRRILILVKHPPASKLRDYLVVRDETRGAEPQQLNIHLLVRDVKRDGPLIRCAGQWDTDALLFLAHAEETGFKVGRWFYYDENMTGPGEYKPPARRKGAGAEADEAKAKAWAATIVASDGRALIPPAGWDKEWLVGEYQKWLQLATRPGTPLLWVLYPRKNGPAKDPEPTFESLNDGRGVRVTVGGESEIVCAASDWPEGSKRPGMAWILRDGTPVQLLDGNALPPLGKIPAPE